MAFKLGIVFISIFVHFTPNYVQGSVNNYDAISELQQQIQDILERQKSYEIKLAEQQKVIDEQAIEISSLKRFVFQRFDSIQESNVRTDDTQKEALENLFSVQKTINKISRNELSTVNEDSKLRRYHGKEEVADYHNFQSPILKKRQVSSIAFSVFLSHDADLGGDQIVKFDKIITNEGNGYNVHSGAFTCPEGGIYLFSYFVGESNVRGIWLNLKVNSVNIIDAAVDTFNPSQDLQGGNTVVLRLKTGDVVVIESRGGHVEGSDSIRLTSFSGVLLSF